MLDESNKEMQAADRRERQKWFVNACPAMPMVSFIAVERETTDASMRYLQPVAPVHTAPVIAFPATTSGQAIQYSAQYAPQPNDQRDQPQSYLLLLQDQRPTSHQSYTITNVETGSICNSQIHSTTGVWNPNTSSSSVIAQNFHNETASGTTNYPEIEHLPGDGE